MADRRMIAARAILVLSAGAIGVAAVADLSAASDRSAPIVPARHLAAPASVRHRPMAIAAPPPVAAPPLIVRRILDVGGPIAFGDYAWDEKDVPAGPLVITVDLAAQTLSVFRDGYEIGATAILYGADDKPTPLGTFPITAKDATHVSRTYGGAPMPYMLRLTADGVSIHGSRVEWGYATHGCIGVPTAFAKKLFAVAQVGDRVIITNGRSMALGQAITA